MSSVFFLAGRILKWFLDFWKIFALCVERYSNTRIPGIGIARLGIL